MPAAELMAQAGSLRAVSAWKEVTQEVIDTFANATGDHQFIHVDPARAAETPFGGTIAHGFLTLSLLSSMAYDALPAAAEAVMGINYGFDKVRFLSPVPSGSRIRAHFALVECGERKPGELLSRYEVTVEIEGSDSPALAANWLGLAILANKGKGDAQA
ncbi:MAG: MaoC family dehydratase [Pseudomonadota bacterium]|nr:MaoC family dehydratase [Pseudomonadota bacterium]